MSSAADPIRILFLAGSLREGSMNRLLARAAARLAPEDVEEVTLDSLGAVEPFDEDVERTGFPPGATAFVEQLRAVDGVFVATPEYNGSIPGQLKNAFDWASRPERGTGGLQASAMFGMPFAVVSASNGQFGGVWARDELTKALRTQGARAVDGPQVAVPRGDVAFAEDGTLLNRDTQERLRELVAALAHTARLVRDARARTREGTTPTAAA